MTLCTIIKIHYGLQDSFPLNVSEYFDPNINGALNGQITKYFHEASFGEFVFLGDYYPQLIQVDFNQAFNLGREEIVEYLNNLPGNDFLSANGLSFKQDFDTWGQHYNQLAGMPKDKTPNGRIDVFLIYWRVNSRYSAKMLSGVGFTSETGFNFNIKGMTGADCYIFLKDLNSSPLGEIKHEYAHNIFGRNNFHTGGGGADEWHFLSVPNVNSSLAYSSSISSIYSALERRRIGWKPANAQYQVKAKSSTTQNEINTDFEYGQNLTVHNNEVILSDYVSTGDAIRIRLPYLKSETDTVQYQWLWLENHQKKAGFIDHGGRIQPKGVYAYMQVGKEIMTGSEAFAGQANYTWLIHPYGNYDFLFTDLKSPKNSYNEAEGNMSPEEYVQHKNIATVQIDTLNLQNPFTGYGINIEGAFDLGPSQEVVYIPQGDSVIVDTVIVYDQIFRNETLIANKLIVNGKEYPASYFDYMQYTVFGSIFDAFQVGNKISIATNPSSTPLYTYKQKYGKHKKPYSSKQPHDNNKIYLNGLSVEFVEQYANGDIKVRILWDKYDVDNNVRWCGDIVLNEKVNLLENKTITLDYGTMPTRPVDPVMFNGKKVFNDPTVFTCNAGSEFIQQANSTVIVKNQSALKLKEGATYRIEDGATLIIKSGSKLETDACSKIVINGTGKLIYETGAISAIAPGTVLDFENGSQNFAEQDYTNYLENSLEIAFVLPPTYSISTTSDWTNSSYQLTRNLVIENHGSLKLFQGEINCQTNAKIVVKPGGKLVVDAAKITNSTCSDKWQGIQLIGNPNVNQTTINQPIVELKNGAIIENAMVGIYTGDLSNPGNNGGGIVRANGATFRNCIEGISMQPYRNMIPGTTIEQNNASYISKCSFETTADYLNLSSVDPIGISLSGVKGVSVLGNSFINVDYAAFTFNKRGTGIQISGSTCSIAPHCSGFECENKTRNVFENLMFAIKAIPSAIISDITIKDNEFMNNFHNVYMMGAHNGTAFKNSINLSTEGKYGFYIYANNNFKIEENSVVGSNSGFGVVMKYTTNSNEIYKNSFSKLAYGVYAFDNPYLRLTCNTFLNNTQQVYSEKNGISRNQGSSQTSAGNIFIPDCSESDRELKAINQSISILYYYKNGNADEQPLCATRNFRLYSTNAQNTCPTRHENGEIPTEDKLVLLKSTIADQEEELQAIVDGGSTEKTVDAIETVQDGEELDLMSDLMVKSPYLSEAALVKTATENEVLPEIVIANVLISNPQAAKSSKVQSALDNRPEPMPQYLREVINEGLEIVSDLETKETAISENDLEKEKLLSGLIGLYQNDETADHSDDIESLILAENTLSYDYLAIGSYLANLEYNEAEQLLNSMSSKYTFDEAQQLEYDQMGQILAIHKNLNNQNYFELTAAQKATLYTLAEAGFNRANLLAQGILTLVDRAEFPLPEIIIEEEENSNKNSIVEAVPVFAFNVSPNPANHYFVVEYNLATKKIEDAEVRLFNKNGKQVYKQGLTKRAFQLLIKTEDFEPGVYVCRLYNSSKQMDSKTIVIKPNQMTESDIISNAEAMFENETLFLVYPNPTTNFVTVNTNQTEGCVLEIYNASGVRVYLSEVEGNTTKINTTNYETGIYHLRLVKEGLVLETTKLFVE